jgi:hypothetical protein
MKNKYTARLTFTDHNTPKLKQVCKDLETAEAQISHWSKQFAGISVLDIFTPENEKICYNANGTYFFTFPAETVKALNLKP